MNLRDAKFEIEELFHAYVEALDDGRYEEWPETRGIVTSASMYRRRCLMSCGRSTNAAKSPRFLSGAKARSLPSRTDAVDCVVSVRLFHWLPTPVKRKMLKEIRRVSKRWLVVEVRHVKSMRRMARMKSFVQKAFGHDAAAPVLDADIAEADWREAMRVPVRGTRHWVAVYEKVP